MSDAFAMRAACPSTMSIFRAGQGVVAAPVGVSSGAFMVQMLLSSCKEGEMTAMRAFVPPGVVTHWHSHPRGQLLFVLEGTGLVQREGGDLVELRIGDAVWFAPSERHWHGATAAGPFGYLSVQPVKNGAVVEWFDPVAQEISPDDRDGI